MKKFRDDVPIYLQLRAEIEKTIINRDIPEGDPIPSIRTISKEYKLNPNTVSKAIAGLVDEGLLFKKRGIGIFINEGAQEKLLERKSKKFKENEMPRIIKKAKRLLIEKDYFKKRIDEIYEEVKK